MSENDDAATRTKQIQELREYCKPDVIDLLYIGESPPHSGKFFYTANSILYQHMQESFQNVFPDCGSGLDFIMFFISKNCFLDDLCLSPIDHLNDYLRNEERKMSVHLLANRLKEYNPKHIVVVMKAIMPHIENAVLQSGLKNIPITSLPFPAHSETNVRNFVSLNTKIIKTVVK